jgi:hypothetical protein
MIQAATMTRGAAAVQRKAPARPSARPSVFIGNGAPGVFIGNGAPGVFIGNGAPGVFTGG